MPVERAVEEATGESCCCLERDEQSRPSASEGSDDAEERDRTPCRRSAASSETSRADRAPARIAMMLRSATVHRAVEVQHKRCR